MEMMGALRQLQKPDQAADGGHIESKLSSLVGWTICHKFICEKREREKNAMLKELRNSSPDFSRQGAESSSKSVVELGERAGGSACWEVP